MKLNFKAAQNGKDAKSAGKNWIEAYSKYVENNFSLHTQQICRFQRSK